MKTKASPTGSLAKRIISGCIIAFAVFFMLFAIVASLVMASSISEEDMPRLVAGIAFVGTFAGSLAAAGQGGEKRPLAGFLTAAVLILIRAVVSAFLPEGTLFSSESITATISMMFAGSAAGLLSAGKTKKRKRHIA